MKTSSVVEALNRWKHSVRVDFRLEEGLSPDVCHLMCEIKSEEDVDYLSSRMQSLARFVDSPKNVVRMIEDLSPDSVVPLADASFRSHQANIRRDLLERPRPVHRHLPRFLEPFAPEKLLEDTKRAREEARTSALHMRSLGHQNETPIRHGQIYRLALR